MVTMILDLVKILVEEVAKVQDMDVAEMEKEDSPQMNMAIV